MLSNPKKTVKEIKLSWFALTPETPCAKIQKILGAALLGEIKEEEKTEEEFQELMKKEEEGE